VIGPLVVGRVELVPRVEVVDSVYAKHVTQHACVFAKGSVEFLAGGAGGAGPPADPQGRRHLYPGVPVAHPHQAVRTNAEPRFGAAHVTDARILFCAEALEDVLSDSGKVFLVQRIRIDKIVDGHVLLLCNVERVVSSTQRAAQLSKVAGIQHSWTVG
jgi:hypothetical protein